VHYSEKERDFMVNMAGCQFGRDCWGEMYQYREFSKKLNRTRWQRLKDGLGELYSRLLPKEDNPQEQQQ
jgi:mannan polymerase II complex MNN10 subunit